MLQHYVEQSFLDYITAGKPQSGYAIPLQFAARLSALASFDGDIVQPPLNMPWNFLI